jgi:hypothetical protein
MNGRSTWLSQTSRLLSHRGQYFIFAASGPYCMNRMIIVSSTVNAPRLTTAIRKPMSDTKITRREIRREEM